jgi:hypothetical protein
MEDLKFKTAENMMRDNLTTADADFYTNQNKGFAMLINGYRISVQWGPGNYVDSEVRYGNDFNAPMQHETWGSGTAEVLIWDEQGRFARNVGASLFDLAPWSDELDEYDFEWCNRVQGGHNDQVFGHCSSDCVARMIGCLASCGDSDPRPGIAQIYNASFK